MEQLIIHPTDTSQWHALVNDAQLTSNITLHEHTESYLVFLLMRFTQGTALVESIIAPEYLEARHQPRHQQLHTLQEVGDKSLLFCGLFPGMAEKRRVSIDYYVQMGQSAYYSAGEQDPSAAPSLFYRLCEQFEALSNVLMAMRTSVYNTKRL